MNKNWMWGASVLALGLSTLACDKKSDGPTPAVTKETPASGAAAQDEKKSAKKMTASSAVEHLPGGCLATVAINFKAAASDPLVKEHLVTPLDTDLKRVLSTPREDEKDVKRALELLGVKSTTQLHSFAMCAAGFDFETGKPESFGVIVGGEFGVTGDVLSVAAKMATDDKKATFSSVKVAGVDALKNDHDKTLLAQAPSGALIAASDEKMLASMLKPSDAYKKYELALDRQLSIVVSESLAQEAMKKGGKGSPLENLKAGKFSLSGSFDGKLSGVIAMPSEKEATESAAALNLLKAQMAQAPDPSLQMILKSVSLTAEGSSLTLRVELPKELVESGIRDMGKQLQAEIAADKPAPTK